MRWCFYIILSLLLGSGVVSAAKATRITKVLPHLLDEKGRHTLSPSLYERDAYQDHLRKHPELCSALRFDIHWSGLELKRDNLKLRMELRVSGEPKNLIIEEAVKPSAFSGNWSQLTLGGDAYKKAGKIIAWRATLWEGDQQVGELKSFLW